MFVPPRQDSAVVHLVPKAQTNPFHTPKMRARHWDDWFIGSTRGRREEDGATERQVGDGLAPASGAGAQHRGAE